MLQNLGVYSVNFRKLLLLFCIFLIFAIFFPLKHFSVVFHSKLIEIMNSVIVQCYNFFVLWICIYRKINFQFSFKSCYLNYSHRNGFLLLLSLDYITYLSKTEAKTNFPIMKQIYIYLIKYIFNNIYLI